MPITPISDFRKGIDNHPAFSSTKAQMAAADLLNLEVDKIGRLVMRDGYVLEDSDDVSGDGEQVIKVHFIGDENRDAFSRIYRLDPRETWVFNNGRLFVAGVREPQWIDVEDNTAYDWELEIPTGSITEISPDPIILDGDGLLFSHRFAICFTFYSTKFGIESLPSTSSAFVVAVPRGAVDVENAPGISFTATYSLGVVPGWADEVRFYMMTVPFGSDNFFVPDPGPNSIDGDSSNTVAAAYASRERLANIQGTVINTQKVIEAGYRFNLIGRLGASTAGDFVLESERDLAVNFIYVSSTDLSGDEITGPEIDSERFSEGLRFLYLGNPPENFKHLIEQAGRIWGYDLNSNTIRYSLIDGYGTSVYDVFPFENVEIPHAVNVPESYQSGVIHLEPIPPTGGLYVFFSSAIRSITGRALLTGMYSPQTPPQTDLDASGGINGVGTLSPNSVVAFRSIVVFLGSDKTVYQLSGGASLTVSDIGLRIQSALDEISDDDLPNVFAFGFNDRYYLSLPGEGTYWLDVKRKYWGRLDVEVKSAFWSRGGEDNESILYAVRDDNQLIRLFEGEDDAGEPIVWAWESNELGTPSFTNFTELFCRHSGETAEVDIAITVDGQEITGTFSPTPANNYRFGFYARGSLLKTKVSGIGTVPRFQQFEINHS